jgi:hydrogenase maturation factor
MENIRIERADECPLVDIDGGFDGVKRSVRLSQRGARVLVHEGDWVVHNGFEVVDVLTPEGMLAVRQQLLAEAPLWTRIKRVFVRGAR